MNSNSQPIKLFLIVAFSCTSLLANLTPVLAKPTPNRSNAKTILAQAKTFNQPPIPSGSPPGGRVRGGAKRGELAACPLTKIDLTALVPFTQEANSVINVWGQTTIEHPSWFFYVPYTKDSPYTVEFVLQDGEANEVYKKAIALSDKPGVIRVSLPSNASGLAVDKQYRWFFTINCDKQKNSPPSFVEGVIKRVNLSQPISKEIETAEPIKRYAIYAQNGIWYEALTTLAELRQKNPQDTALKAEWRNLLGSIRLDDVAGEPILPETP
ncbi:DUF928 domain-containing protein [Nostoc sp. DedQUE09]|uniref:DUF928 domain-containing protein n=1 Tax=Nostoc sp. DedQUE09 TaxID=3075394 RepID=UPI002AD24F93|nr:DUF928 domain-containing protein [Nostoc sp. DedQUE09]MDZ7951676.1 DUF928 domain-containing protein [Nostoc sp. DedQUE09]